MGSELPKPTRDDAQAEADLSEHGYCLIADALAAEEVDRVRSRLVEVAHREVADGSAFIDSAGANQRVWQLINRGAEFTDLITSELPLRWVDHVLGGHLRSGALGHSRSQPADGLPQFLLSSFTANIAGPGGDAMVLHADQGYVPTPWPEFPLVVNCGWMLDDFTEENGATVVVPGSHREGRHPTSSDGRGAVQAVAPAGTMIVFEGRLWHGTGPNTTSDQLRRVVLGYFCQPWIRAQENHSRSVKPEVLETASPVLRRLLGHDLYGSLGMNDGLPPTGLDPSAHHLNH